MRLLSPILHRMVYPVLGSAGYFHSRRVAPVTVITYHGVLPAGYRSEDAFLDNTLVSENTFRAQLRLLKKHYNVVPPETFRLWVRDGKELPPKAVLLTCDDGLLNHLTVMAPILKEEQLKCLFFVTGASSGDEQGMLWYVELYLLVQLAKAQEKPTQVQGIAIPEFSDVDQRRAVWLGLMKSLSRAGLAARQRFLQECAERLGLSAAWKSRYLGDPLLRSRFQLLASAELGQLRDAGMAIGAHTMSHPVLGELDEESARVEIAGSRAAIERSLGEAVWAIAYPFGDPASVGDREFKLAESAGYDCAFVNVAGTVDRNAGKFALPRIHVTAEMSLPVYEAYVSGFHDALRNRLRPAAAGA